MAMGKGLKMASELEPETAKDGDVESQQRIQSMLELKVSK